MKSKKSGQVTGVFLLRHVHSASANYNGKRGALSWKIYTIRDVNIVKRQTNKQGDAKASIVFFFTRNIIYTLLPGFNSAVRILEVYEVSFRCASYFRALAVLHERNYN
jgi:hypothetical protein